MATIQYCIETIYKNIGGRGIREEVGVPLPVSPVV